MITSLRGKHGLYQSSGTHDVLASCGLVAGGEPITVEPLTGGVSSDVVRVTSPRQRFVLKRALPQLKVKEEWWADTRRNRTERAALEAIGAMDAPFVPKILLADDEESLYAMEDVPGIVWKRELLDGRVDSEVAVQLGRFFDYVP